MSFEKRIQKVCKLNLKEHIFYFTCNLSNYTDAINKIMLNQGSWQFKCLSLY